MRASADRQSYPWEVLFGTFPYSDVLTVYYLSKTSYDTDVGHEIVSPYWTSWLIVISLSSRSTLGHKYVDSVSSLASNMNSTTSKILKW